MFPILVEKQSVSFTMQYDVICRFFVDILYQVKKVPLYSLFAESLYQKSTLVLLNDSSPSMVIIFFVVDIMSYIDSFLNCPTNLDKLYLVQTGNRVAVDRIGKLMLSACGDVQAV